MYIPPLVTAQQMRDIDRRSTEEYGIPSIILMENAGRAVFQAANALLDCVDCGSVVVVAGPGNNGGDGFVAARFFYNAGADVQVYYFGDRSKSQGDARTNLEIAERMGISIDYSQDTDNLRMALFESDLLIDAYLGTGIKGVLRENAQDVIHAMSERGAAQCISVDIPSGIDADTAMPLGHPDYPAVSADITVTFGLPKIGLYCYPGRAYAGGIIVADIGIPADLLADSGSNICLLTDKFPLYVVNRAMDSNKGDYGHLAVVAGSVGMTGAAVLAAQGALRMGAGLVTVAVPESLNDIMEVKITEAMTIPVPENNARAFGMKSLDKVIDVINERDAAVIGPGFGRDGDTVDFTLELIKRLKKPAVLDADALYALAADPDILRECRVPIVITPHPGEMARLVGTTASEVQSNRLDIAESFAREYGVAVVLKGAGTVVADPDGTLIVNSSGNPGMASGGTGDVLTGMIGALIATDKKIQPALLACTAVYIHGRAGDLAAEKLGETSLVASDIVEKIPDAIAEYINDDTERE